MMAKTAGMLEALEKYYELTYSKVMSSAIIAAIGPENQRQYLMDLYLGITEMHSVSYRSLPDLAIVQKVRRTLNRPDTYRDITGEPALPEPPISPVMDDAIKAAIARIGEGGIGNAEEVERVRAKAKRGDASLYQLWWLECIDSRKPYRAMPEDYEARHPGATRW